MRRLTALSVLAMALLFLLDGISPEIVEAQSARQRLRDIMNRQRDVRGELKEIKEEQVSAQQELADARNAAQRARTRSSEASRQLEQVRAELREVRADLERTEKQLGGHREAVSARLLAIYRSGEPSYLEVVLNATSFEDFTNRAEYSRLIARQDQRLLDELIETENKLTEHRATLEVKHAEAEALKQEADRQKQIADRAESQAAALVERYRKDRAAAERALAQLEAAENELQAIVRAEASTSRGGGYSGTSTGRYSLPVSGRITSRYGYRVHPIYGVRRFHNGVDIAAPTGTPIRSCDDGRVIFAGWRGLTGLTVIIDHGSGWSTSYGHCSRIYVSRGQIVSSGQTIAAVGSTGLSTGPHVHWMVYYNGSHRDPLR